jgi:chromosome segregation ATPase
LVKQTQEEGTGLKDIAEDIKNMHSNNRSLKDQNTRLMTVNEKLLEESEGLRKEIYRLRTLFGQENYLSSNRQGRMEQGDRDHAATRITELMVEIKMLSGQKQATQMELDNVNKDRASLLRKIQEMQQDFGLLRTENGRLQDALRNQAGPSSQIESLLRQQSADRGIIEDLKVKLRLAEDKMDQDSSMLKAIASDRDRLANDRNSLIVERERLAQQLRMQPTTSAQPSSQTLEIENLRMNIGQLEKERDLARKRLSESNADLSAQLDKVSGLEKQVADLRSKAVQGPSTTSGPGEEHVASMQRVLSATQSDLEAARKELDSARFELNNTRSQHSAALLKEADTRKQEAAAYTRKIQDLADDLQTLRVANNQLQESLKSQSGPSSQVDLLLRQQAADKATIEESQEQSKS